jgi:hypothetical protein
MLPFVVSLLNTAGPVRESNEITVSHSRSTRTFHRLHVAAIVHGRTEFDTRGEVDDRHRLQGRPGTRRRGWRGDFIQVKDKTRAQGYRNASEKARSVILSLNAEIYITDQLAGVERKPLRAGYMCRFVHAAAIRLDQTRRWVGVGTLPWKTGTVGVSSEGGQTS